jgi:hypothetical protein
MGISEEELGKLDYFEDYEIKDLPEELELHESGNYINGDVVFFIGIVDPFKHGYGEKFQEKIKFMEDYLDKTGIIYEGKIDIFSSELIS